jgi:hypothetical protein
MNATRKANIMFGSSCAMVLFNGAMSLVARKEQGLFLLCAALWGIAALAYYFLDFDGKSRR